MQVPEGLRLGPEALGVRTHERRGRRHDHHDDDDPGGSLEPLLGGVRRRAPPAAVPGRPFAVHHLLRRDPLRRLPLRRRTGLDPAAADMRRRVDHNRRHDSRHNRRRGRQLVGYELQSGPVFLFCFYTCYNLDFMSTYVLKLKV